LLLPLQEKALYIQEWTVIFLISVLAWCYRIMPIIPAAWEAEIRRITFQGQLRLKVQKPLFLPIAVCGGTHVSSQLQEKHK
jgi:hypothetical protein